MLVLCRWHKSGDYSLGEIKKEIVLNNIHIKYNFRIQPVKNKQKIIVSNFESVQGLFLYPQEIDFYKYNEAVFYLYMNYPNNGNEVILKDDNLKCTSYFPFASIPFKKCFVYKNDYLNSIGHKYYNIYISSKYSIYLYQLAPILIKRPKSNEIVIKIKNDNSMKIQKKGTLYLDTYYSDNSGLRDRINSNDIERKTVFDSIIFDDRENRNEYSVKCKLWKSRNDNYNISVICNLNEDLKYSSQKIALKDAVVNYNEYTIYIYSDDYIKVEQVDYNIPFLYSDEQTIHINENNIYLNYYNLVFNFESYNNDILYLYGTEDNYLLLDNCSPGNNKLLTCKIPTGKLNETITTSGNNFSVGTMNDNFGIMKLNNILPIQILYNNVVKETIFVNLLNSLGSNYITGVPFGFETNKNDIPNLITSKFWVGNNYCYFKKVTGKNLYFLCSSNVGGNININVDSTYYNYHFKYNFYVENGNKAMFSYSGIGSDIKLIYPGLLDFSKSDSLIIRYIKQNSTSEKIRINPDGADLGCKYINGMSLCHVSIAHFRDKNSETYYYNYPHSNGIVIPYYSSSAIKVILPEDNSNKIYISIKDEQNKQYLDNNNIFYLITNYSRSYSIIDNFKIPQSSFNAKFTIDPYYSGNNFADGTCDFWEPGYKNWILICKFEYEKDISRIYFNEIRLKYENNKELFIFSNSPYSQFSHSSSKISFLYSEEKEIDLNDNIDSYEFKFKKISYYNNQLVLQKESGDNKFKKIFFVCDDKGTEVSYNMKKGELVQILSYSGEKFKLYQVTDSFGLTPINSIGYITLNYPNVTKKEIYLEITKLLTPFDDRNIVVYETNITNIPQLTTDNFYIKTNQSETLDCRFKKNSNKNEDKLLLICNTDGINRYDNSLAYMDRNVQNNSNYLYDFIITYKKNETFYKYDSNNFMIYSVYPDELDFNKQDSYNLWYETKYSTNNINLTLNTTSLNGLNCNRQNNSIKCKVTQDHFNKSDDYHTYYYNNKGNVNLLYEVKTIKVILKTNIPEPDSSSSSSSDNNPDKGKDNNLVGIIVGSVIGGLVVIGIIIFLVLRCRSKGSVETNDKKAEPLQIKAQLD